MIEQRIYAALFLTIKLFIFIFQYFQKNFPPLFSMFKNKVRNDHGRNN